MSEINFSLDNEFKKTIEDYLKNIIEDCRKTINKYIIENIYNAYSPTEYIRTNQMGDINNISYKILDDGSVFVYINTDNMHYYSALDEDRTVTELIPWMLEQTGHMDGTGIHNMYHYYTERHPLRDAVEELQNKYPDINFSLELNEPGIF